MPLPTTATGAPTRAAIKWSDLDVCTLLDEMTVQEITGESEGFATDGRQEASGGSCFWGVTRAGHPAYVEVTVGNSSGTPRGFNPPGQTCSKVPVAGIGTAAIGGTCPAPPQLKVYLSAVEDGVQVMVLVNEPKRALDPGDLAAYANEVLQQIR